jgi:acetate kinase
MDKNTHILIVNVGSTSFKYKLYAMENETILSEGKIERVGKPDSKVIHRTKGRKKVEKIANIGDYAAAIQEMVDLLTDPEVGAVKKLKKINAVAFKTVHAKGVNDAVLINDLVVDAMEAYNGLVPAHNPPYINAIKIFKQLLPELPLVGVFETAFHRDMPETARVYGVPYEWYEKHGIRRYGFHGASHRYIAETVPKLLKKVDPQNLRIISCHLGGSSSMCAIRNGVSIDTTMGFSAQEGLVNSTRCGDLDPFVPLYMIEKQGLSVEEVRQALCKQGGLAGIAGSSGDVRDLLVKEKEGDRRAKLALDVFIYGVKKYIGAYFVALGGADAVVFTGGIGENGIEVRSRICDSDLAALGIKIDPDKNAANTPDASIAAKTSRVDVLVVPTNEELIVAREALRVLKREGLA